MKILMLKDYFFPENCAGISMTNDLLKKFSEASIEAYVYTPIPCRGIDDDIRIEYRHRKKETLYNSSVHVHRYWLPYERKSVLLRGLRYLLQNCIQFIKGISHRKDLLFLGSTPPTNGFVGAILKKLTKMPFVYNLQDIFPDSMLTAGFTSKGSLLWKIGRAIENKTYACADEIIVISESFKRNLLEKGVPEEKIKVIPNWIDTDAIVPVRKEDNRLFKEYDIDPKKFVVVYAGNFGKAQGAEILIDVADMMRDDDSVQFVIFGGGVGFESAKEQVAQKELVNVKINPLLPQDRIAEVYSLGDVAVITCKKDVGDSGMPSKTWSIMACNTPIIASFDLGSELSDVLEKANAGFCVEPEDTNALVEAIKKASQNQDDIRYTGGRDYVKNTLAKDKCVAQYVDVFKRVVKEKDQ